jgi:hypothetical protein
LLNASQFGFCANYSMTLQCIGLTDHVTLYFNNNMSTAAVFLDIEKAFDTVWSWVCYINYPDWNFQPVWFLSKWKFRVFVEGDMSMPRYIPSGVPQGSILSPTLYNLYINDTPQATGVNRALFADDT